MVSSLKKVKEHLNFLIRKFTVGKADGIILCYHRVLPQKLVTNYGPNKGLIVNEVQFEEQMRYVATNCEPMSLDDLLANKKPSGKRPVSITFDDGTADNLIYALPILEKFNIPATIYITTGFVLNEVQPWWHSLWAKLEKSDQYSLACENFFCVTSSYAQKITCFKTIHNLILSGDSKRYENINTEIQKQSYPLSPIDRFLTPSEIGELANHPLISIGLHTHSHKPVTIMTDDEFAREMEMSAGYLESWTKKTLCHFAYPYGKYHKISESDAAQNELRKFKTASTTTMGYVDIGEMYRLCRISISGALNYKYFKTLMF